MNLFHTLRQEAEFANIVFVCAGPAVLDKPGKFDYTAIRKALCPKRRRLTPYRHLSAG